MLRLLPDVDVKKGCRVTIDPDCTGNLFYTYIGNMARRFHFAATA